MSIPLILAVSGKKRAGKDTAADVAVEDFGFTKYPMATPIKEGVRSVFHLTDEQLYGDKKGEVDPWWDTTPRTIMQKFGTNMGRHTFGEDLWVRSFKKWAQETDEERVVVSDLRFPNEVQGIHALGGIVLRVKRPEVEPDLNPVVRWLCQQFPSLVDYFGPEYHPSETALDHFEDEDFDLTVVNDSSLEEYRTVIHQLLRKLGLSTDG